MGSESGLQRKWAVAEWWEQRTGLEKVGVAAIGAGGAAVVAVALVPEMAAAAVGGGLTAAGAWFLRRGFKSS